MDQARSPRIRLHFDHLGLRTFMDLFMDIGQPAELKISL